MEMSEELAEAPVEVERVSPDDAGGEGGAWQPWSLGAMQVCTTSACTDRSDRRSISRNVHC